MTTNKKPAQSGQFFSSNRLKPITALICTLFFLFSGGSAMAQPAQQSKPTKLHFTAKEQAWLDKHPEIIVGFVPDMSPILVFKENEQHQGILPEYLALLSKHIGIDFRIELAPSWKEMTAKGIRRETDILGLITPHNNFSSYFDFTQVVLNLHFYIYAPNHMKIREYSLSDLAGKSVGYMESAHIVESFAKRHPKIDFVAYSGQESLFNALITEQVEFVIHTVTLEYWRQKKRLLTFKVGGFIPELDTDVVMGVRNDWPELRSILNKALSSTQKEGLAIIEHWYGYKANGVTAKKPIELTQEEQSWLAQHPVLRVGIDPFWAPIEFLGDGNTPQGISIQYLQRLETILGIQFEFSTGLSWPEVLQRLERSQLDLVPAMSINPSRRELFNFTSPYLSSPNAIFSAVDRAFLGGLDALRGKRVVVVQGYAIQAWLEAHYPDLELITAPNLVAALQEVANGNAYALVGNLIATSYYIGKTGLTQIRVVGETPFINNLGVAIRKDWTLLPGILQKGLDAIPQSEKEAIYNDWISIKYKHSVDYTLLWQILGMAAVVLLTLFYWNYRLAREVAHRRQVESALLIAKHEAEQAAHAKTDFLTHMSHEIRTPMNAVIGLGALIDETELTAQQRYYRGKMRSSSEALLRIIDKVLNFSRGEAGKLILESTAFSLEQTLQEIVHTLDAQAREKELKLNTRISSNIPDRLIGDADKLAQILLNLGSNGIKFTEKGHVTFSVDLLELASDNARLRFTVQDSGLGMSLDQQQKLFKPFSQGDASITRRYGGTGLGLVISQQLAQLMGSEITVESQWGEGSRFAFIIQFGVSEAPIQKSLPHASRQSALKQPIPELVGKKVLLVEDDDLNRLIAQKFLIAFGTQVKTAENGKKALAFLKQESFDIVLMDIQMPEMDGYETVNVLRREKCWRHVPIIALTAHALSVEREKCLAAGMNDHLSKPIRPPQLRDMLLKWIRLSQ